MVRERSASWGHFRKVPTGTRSAKYKCKYCSTEYSGNITRLTDHLNQCHGFLSASKSPSPPVRLSPEAGTSRVGVQEVDLEATNDHLDREDCEELEVLKDLERSESASDLDEMQVLNR
jgi:hypothetical protein